MTAKTSGNQRPLNIVVLYSSGHLGSAIVMNKLINAREINVVGVVKAEAIKLSISERSKIQKHFTNIGWKFAWLLLWQRIIQGLAYGITLALPFLRKRLKPAWKIAIDHDIPVFHCRNINDPDCESFLKEIHPDLLVSAYFSQILKANIIKIPRRGVLNIHPGWLPSYKGAMAYFWVLKNGSDQGGVSVHWIDEGIDTGELLARKSFLIQAKATQDTVLRYSAVIGSRLLIRVIRTLQANKEPK